MCRPLYVKRWVLNPSLGCPGLMKVERRRVGSEFQTTTAAMSKFRIKVKVKVKVDLYSALL